MVLDRFGPPSFFIKTFSGGSASFSLRLVTVHECGSRHSPILEGAVGIQQRRQGIFPHPVQGHGQAPAAIPEITTADFRLISGRLPADFD